MPSSVKEENKRVKNQVLLNKNLRAILGDSGRLLSTISSGGVQGAVAFFGRVLFNHNWSGGFEESERGLGPFVESRVSSESRFFK